MTSLRGAPERVVPLEVDLAASRSGSSPELYAQYVSSTGEQKRELRNQIVLTRLYGTDIAYSEFESQLTRERQGIGFAASTTNIALTTAATAVGAKEAKTALSAVAAALAGTREAYEQEVLVDRTISLLQSQMQTERKRIKARILHGIEQNTQVYPVELALSDVEAYYRAGTITGALVGMSEDTGVRLREASELEAQAITAKFGTTPFRSNLRDFFHKSVRHRAAVDCWLRGSNLKASLVMNSPIYADLQRRMFEELVLGRGAAPHHCLRLLDNPAALESSRSRVHEGAPRLERSTSMDRTERSRANEVRHRSESHTERVDARSPPQQGPITTCTTQPGSETSRRIKTFVEVSGQEAKKALQNHLQLRGIKYGLLLNCAEYESERLAVIQSLSIP